MRRRLDIAASLIARPPVLFLDEPTTGLDLTSRRALWDMIREQVAGGVTVLLTTQYLEEADQLADRVAVIDGGLVIADGTPDELKRQVGGERLRVAVATPAELTPVAEALRGLNTGAPSVDPEALTVSVPLAEGVGAIALAAAALDGCGARITDFGVHKPSMDDVFLSLTQREPAQREELVVA
jgi:ABC-2 type transport system ATP-binding protein